MKELLVIYPGKDTKHDSIGCGFGIYVAKTGECLATHFCSNYSFAWSDLYARRTERINEWQNRFGDFEVKFIDETNLNVEVFLSLKNEVNEK